jgi:peptidoglycan lytic transglycosylase
MRKGMMLAAATMSITMSLALAAPAHASSMVSSYYWQGRETANGEHYNSEALTAAHKTLPFGTRLRVSYKGKSVIVRVNDRGPFIKGRQLDLSRGAARQLGMLNAGVANVQVDVM